MTTGLPRKSSGKRTVLPSRRAAEKAGAAAPMLRLGAPPSQAASSGTISRSIRKRIISTLHQYQVEVHDHECRHGGENCEANCRNPRQPVRNFRHDVGEAGDAYEGLHGTDRSEEHTSNSSHQKISY